MQYIRRIPYYTLVALLVYMPFHIFLSQSLSLVTGGLEVWKVAKDALLVIGVVFTICLVFQERKGTRAFWALVALLVAYSVLHLLLWAFHPDIYGRSAVLGMIFNIRLPAFAVLGMGAFLTTPRQFAFSSLSKIILGVSTLVAVLGLLQYVLPKDILTHVGYSIDRGVRPAFFIDDNPAFPRIMSTLREPNSLAAYLLLPIGLLTAMLVRHCARQKRLILAGLLLVHGAALYLTQSRSALLAALVTVGLVCMWQYRAGLAVLLKRWWPLIAALAVAACLGLYTFRNDSHIQGLISHSTPDAGQADDLDSNDYHWLFFKQGVEGIIHNPLGHGPGTAGLASIQNPDGSFLTENYYVQVGYEVGIVGLALFMALNMWLYARLRRSDSSLAIALLASFWGYVIMNMLLHIWANEAVAAQWWILAGVVISATQSSDRPMQSKLAKKRPTPKRPAT